MRRLESQLHTCEARYELLSTEFLQSHERCCHDKAHLARCLDEVVVHEESREQLSDQCAQKREEYKEALRELAAAKERLAVVDQTLKRRESDLQSHGEREQTLGPSSSGARLGSLAWSRSSRAYTMRPRLM